MSEQWTLRVDPSVCRCNAMCVAVAPELFTLADGLAQASVGVIDDSLLETAEGAQELCPTQAITIERLTPTLAAGQ